MNNEYSKIMKAGMAFSRVGVGLVLVCCSLQINFALAMGGKPGSDNPADAIQKLAQSFIMNPQIAIIQDQFNNAKTPVFTRDEDGSISFSDAIVMNRRYNCRIFYALTRSSMMVKPDDNIWYEFNKFSDISLDNTAFNEFHRVKNFAPHYMPLKPEQNNELWGSSTEQTYYEAIRVKKNGDLLIIGFSDKYAWIRQALGIFNMDDLASTMLQAMQGFMNSKFLAFPWDNMGQAIDGLILGYGVCPKNPSPTFHMIGDEAEALKYLDYEQSLLQ